MSGNQFLFFLTSIALSKFTAAEVFTFNGTVNNDFLVAANWSGDSGGTATPANMGASDTYIVANSTTLFGTASLSGNLDVNAAMTLTVSGTGLLNLDGGAELAIAQGGIVSVSGTLNLNSDGAAGNPTTISGTSFPSTQGLRIESTGSFSRSGSGYSVISGRVTNHGIFTDDPGLNDQRATWNGMNLTNSISGTATLYTSSTSSFSCSNAGLFTIYLPLDWAASTQNSASFTNSGTLNIPDSPIVGGSEGVTAYTDLTLTNTATGIIHGQGNLTGLLNSGTVNLTGNAFIDEGSSLSETRNEAGAIINQGSHRLSFDRMTNNGTWTSSGEINFQRYQSRLTVGPGGLLNNDGTFTFEEFSPSQAKVIIQGTLAGDASLVIPTTASLELAGGDISGTVIANGTNTMTAGSSISGSLTLPKDLSIPASQTLAVSPGGILAVESGAELAITQGGIVSVSGTLNLNSDGAAGNPTTISGTSFPSTQGLRIESTGSFSRSGSGYSVISGRVTNHGIFTDDPGLNDQRATWNGMNLTNSISGTATLYTSSTSSFSCSNAGLFTIYLPLDWAASTQNSASFTNSGTLNIPDSPIVGGSEGVTAYTDLTLTNTATGIIHGQGNLTGLLNSGTVNLTGNAFIDEGSSLSETRNEAGAIINQGSHRLSFDRMTNNGTWTSSGEINFQRYQSRLTVGPGGLLNNDGTFTFEEFSPSQAKVIIQGTLAGDASLVIPTTASLELAGGDISGTVIANGTNTMTASSSISGSLTLPKDLLIPASQTLVVSSGGNLILANARLLGATGSFYVLGTLSTIGSCLMEPSGTLDNSGLPVLFIHAGSTLRTTNFVNVEGGTFQIDGIWEYNDPFSNLLIPNPFSISFAGTTLRGTGTIAMVGNNIIGLEGGRFEPGPESGTGHFTFLGNVVFSNSLTTEIEVDSISQFDTFSASGTVATNGTLEVNFTSNPVADLGRYQFQYTSSQFSSYSTNTSTGLNPARSMTYSPGDPGAFTLISLANAFDEWAIQSGLELGVNSGILDDPNQDGVTNLQHFALATNPLGSGGNEGKQRVSIDTVGGNDYFTITLPVRRGAVFTNFPTPTTTIDGLTYDIQGTLDLSSWNIGLAEVTPALSTGLPGLADLDGDGNPDWEYHTFRFENLPLTGGYFRVKIEEIVAP